MRCVILLGALIASGCDGVTYEIGVSIDRRLDAQLVDGTSQVPFIQRTVEVGHYEDLRDLEVSVDVRYRGADYDVAIPFHECEAVWEPDGAIVDVTIARAPETRPCGSSGLARRYVSRV